MTKRFKESKYGVTTKPPPSISELQRQSISARKKVAVSLAKSAAGEKPEAGGRKEQGAQWTSKL